MHGRNSNPTAASPRVVVCDTPAAAAQAAALRIVEVIRTAIADQGHACLALSGGRTPRETFALLAGPPHADRIEWARVEVFWGDERCVPPDHPESNYRLAREALLSRIPVPPEHVHRMTGELPDPEAVALDYERQLKEAFWARGDDPPRFDLILLGLGADGHTASLFPRAAALGETQRWVVAARVEHLAAWRLTLTPPLLNAARHVLFLVTGGDKAAIVREVLEGPADPDRLPAQLVRPADGRLEWILDRQAASHLSSALPKGSCP